MVCGKAGCGCGTTKPAKKAVKKEVAKKAPKKK